MAKREYTKHQQGIIRRYYDNRDAIDEGRLQELVTNIFLASGKKLAKHWETAEDTMRRLEVPESRIRHVVDSKDATVLAKVVEDIQKGRIKKSAGDSKSAKPSK